MTAKQKAQEAFRIRWTYLMMLLSVTFVVAVFLGRPASSHHMCQQDTAVTCTIPHP